LRDYIYDDIVFFLGCVVATVGYRCEEEEFTFEFVADDCVGFGRVNCELFGGWVEDCVGVVVGWSDVFCCGLERCVGIITVDRMEVSGAGLKASAVGIGV